MCGEKWLTFDDITDFISEINTEFKIELKPNRQQTFWPTTSAPKQFYRTTGS